MLRLGIALLALCLVAGSAQAHSGLISSSPPDNALLETAPREIVLEFSEAVTPLAIAIYNADGAVSDLTDQMEPGVRLSADPAPALEEGTHVLSWRVISADGHPVAGSQVFSVGFVGEAPRQVQQTDAGVLAAIWSARVLVLAIAFGVVGAAIFRSLVAPLPRAMLPPLLIVTPLGLSATAVSVGLQGLDAIGLPLTSIATPRAWTVGFATSYGTALGVTFMAVLLGAVSLTHEGLFSRILAVVAALTLALSFSLSGHAGSAEPQWLTRPAIFVHVAALVFWLGALPPLAVYLASRTALANKALARFSAAVPWAIIPLLVSAAVLAVVQLGPPGRHYVSAYGAILTGKLLLLCLVFALAFINRFRMTDAVLAGGTAQSLLLSVRAEILLVLLIFALVAGWRFTPPPRVLSVLFPDPALERMTNGDWQADVVIDPGVPGLAVVEVLLSRAGAIGKVQEVALSLSQPELGIEPFTRTAQQVAPGHWRVEGLNLPTHGQWDIAVDLRPTRLESTRLEGQVTLRSRSSEPTRQPVVVANAGSLQIADAFSRATLPGASVAGAYFVVINTGTEADRLMSAATPVAEHVTAHGMQIDNQIMRMRQADDGIAIPAGGTVRLEPGGLHLMLEDLREPVVEGAAVPITLTFERAGEVSLQLEALGFAADGFSSHDHH